MFNGIAQGVAAIAAEAARRSALKLAGGLLAAVGVGLLTAAAWIWIAAQSSHLVAAILLGLVYLVAGGIVILIASRKEATRPGTYGAAEIPPGASAFASGVTPFPAGQSVVPPLVAAFFVGLEAARQARRPDPDRPR